MDRRLCGSCSRLDNRSRVLKPKPPRHGGARRVALVASDFDLRETWKTSSHGQHRARRLGGEPVTGRVGAEPIAYFRTIGIRVGHSAIRRAREERQFAEYPAIGSEDAVPPLAIAD